MARPILKAAGFQDGRASDFVSYVSNHPFFDAAQDIFIARAPGRLDLMGGIADYSGSLVLQWPLAEATHAAIQLVPDGRFRAMSHAEGGDPRSVDFPGAEILPNGPIVLGDARRTLTARPSDAWSAYALGVFPVLAQAYGVLAPGARVLVRSDVPEGKGVSSSAALEVSVMQAVTAALGLSISARDLAILAQRVENEVVGAPCGVMDQMASSCGLADHLLALLCQPAELLGHVPLPPDLRIWGIDSGVRHAVTGSDYASVRVAAFMGARVLGVRTGFMDAYLANLTPSRLAAVIDVLPEAISGAEFLARYDGIADTVTTIDPARVYAVRACTTHPVMEHFRVRAFAELLGAPPSPRRSELLGELMFQSHASYSACGLGSDATDRIVDIVRRMPQGAGLLGAKITGGGSGGTVAVLGRADATIDAVARAYGEASGQPARVFAGSSSGSSAFGVLRLGPA